MWALPIFYPCCPPYLGFCPQTCQFMTTSWAPKNSRSCKFTHHQRPWEDRESSLIRVPFPEASKNFPHTSLARIMSRAHSPTNHWQGKWNYKIYSWGWKGKASSHQRTWPPDTWTDSRFQQSGSVLPLRNSNIIFSILGRETMGKKETGRELDPLYHPLLTYRDFPEGYYRPPVTSFNA